MSALYQRARPARFDEVVGQEHVIEVLASAVRRGRIGHAYLFSGPRGVGKTTTARLLAMAANCEREDAAGRPCGTCESCRLVREGSHPDVTELDAASNNSVEDVRDLREKVGLAGLRGGTRVWILDEAHMLSRAAANALLKTLEEPPPGLLFILATTEPEKLPPTILSRCQHFRFRRLSEREIVGKLRSLCAAAGVDAEPPALGLVARVADGGMRDAESMLERLLLLDGTITVRAAEEALGLPPRQRLERMAGWLAERDLAGLLDEAGTLYRQGFSPRTLNEQLARTLRDALVGSVHGQGFRVGLPDGVLMRVIQTLDDESERFLRHDDLYALEVALIKGTIAASGGVSHDADAPAAALAGAASLASAPAPQDRAQDRAESAAEAARPAAPDPVREATVREAPVQEAPVREATAAAPSGGARPGEEAPRGSGPGGSRARAGGGGEAEQQEGAPTPAGAGGDAPPKASAAGTRPLSWRDVKARASAQLKAFLMPARESVEDDVITLRYDAVHRFHHGQLLDRSEELASLVEDVGGPGYTILIHGPDGGKPKKIA